MNDIEEGMKNNFPLKVPNVTTSWESDSRRLKVNKKEFMTLTFFRRYGQRQAYPGTTLHQTSCGKISTSGGLDQSVPQSFASLMDRWVVLVSPTSVSQQYGKRFKTQLLQSKCKRDKGNMRHLMEIRLVRVGFKGWNANRDFTETVMFNLSLTLGHNVVRKFIWFSNYWT